jgi:hypothetical protein
VSDTINVRIGGEDIAVPLILNFAQLKRAWPAIDAVENATNEITRVSAILAFFAALLAKTQPALTQPALEERLIVKRWDPATDGERVESDERLGVITAFREVCEASGLIPRMPPEPGPGAEAAAASPSTAIGTTSSPN